MASHSLRAPGLALVLAVALASQQCVVRFRRLAESTERAAGPDAGDPPPATAGLAAAGSESMVR